VKRNARKDDYLFPNIRVRALVVRSLITGETAVRDQWELRFLKKGSPSPPRTGSLSPDEVGDSASLVDSMSIVTAVSGESAEHFERRFTGKKRFWRVLTRETWSRQAWARFGQEEDRTLRWEPVEFVEYDWRDLPILDAFMEAGRDVLRWLKRFSLAVVGLLGFVAILVLFSGMVGLMSWFVVGILRAGLRREWSLLFDRYGKAAFLLPQLLIGIMFIIQAVRLWPQIRVTGWVTELNRKRKSDGDQR